MPSLYALLCCCRPSWTMGPEIKAKGFVVPWAYYWAIDGGTSECKWRTRDSRTRRISWIAQNWRWLGHLEASGLDRQDAGLSRTQRRRMASKSTTGLRGFKGKGECRTLLRIVWSATKRLAIEDTGNASVYLQFQVLTISKASAASVRHSSVLTSSKIR